MRSRSLLQYHADYQARLQYDLKKWIVNAASQQASCGHTVCYARKPRVTLAGCFQLVCMCSCQHRGEQGMEPEWLWFGPLQRFWSVWNFSKASRNAWAQFSNPSPCKLYSIQPTGQATNPIHPNHTEAKSQICIAVVHCKVEFVCATRDCFFCYFFYVYLQQVGRQQSSVCLMVMGKAVSMHLQAIILRRWLCHELALANMGAHESAQHACGKPYLTPKLAGLTPMQASCAVVSEQARIDGRSQLSTCTGSTCPRH